MIDKLTLELGNLVANGCYDAVVDVYLDRTSYAEVYLTDPRGNALGMHLDAAQLYELGSFLLTVSFQMEGVHNDAK